MNGDRLLVVTLYSVPRSDGTVNNISMVGSGATFGSFPEVIHVRGATVTAVADSEVSTQAMGAVACVFACQF